MNRLMMAAMVATSKKLVKDALVYQSFAPAP